MCQPVTKIVDQTNLQKPTNIQLRDRSPIQAIAEFNRI